MIDFCSQNKIELKENEPLSKHSSFKVGGPAKLAIFPNNKEQLISVIRELKEKNERYIVVGNGSNILFDDTGFNGAIVFTKKLTDIEYLHLKDGKEQIRVDCGYSLTNLASEAGKKHLLTGLEFAYGIPGSVGGAIYMNAGAYGGEISDVVVKSEYFDTLTGEIKTLSADEHKFSYRHSFFAEHPELIILNTTLELTQGDGEEIYAKMQKNMSSRREKQPLEYPNAGSTFKRPEGHFAGKLIEDAGLKGYTVGGAQISEKHAGFIINRGGATSKDILDLIEYIKDVVDKKFNVSLECEIIYVPNK